MASIFEPARLGGQVLRNRLMRSATWMATADDGGYVTDAVVKTYRDLAEGGIGGIVTGMVSVSPVDALLEGQLRLDGDRFVEGHKRIADAAHEFGVPVYVQAGVNAPVRMRADGSLADHPIGDWSDGELAGLVDLFGEGARRARAAGYDGMQLHGAHFWFLSRFLSPLFNQREDKYGGSAENRARLLVEVLERVRAECGEGFTVITKLNCTDARPGGVEAEDFLATCRVLADAGIDGIEVSANGTSVSGIRPGVNEAYFERQATLLAREVDVPVIMVGGHRSVGCMQESLDRSGAAFLSLSRPLIREPRLVRRWMEGDLRPSECVSCNRCYETPGHECYFNLKKIGGKK